MEALRAKYSGPLQVTVRRLQILAPKCLPADWAPAARLQILDHFMTEVGQRFSTRTEERLLAVVYTLQQRTYKTGLPAAAPVPEAFKKELAGAFLGTHMHAAHHVLQAHVPHSAHLLQACARPAAAVTPQVLASWHATNSSLPRTWTPACLVHRRRWAR